VFFDAQYRVRHVMNEPYPDRRRIFGEGISHLKQKYEICLCPGTECASRAIAAHSVQNNGILDRLAEDGHVISPRIQVAFSSEPPNYAFERIGRNKATTFTGLCSAHDTELFKPIDTSPVDIRSAEHLFLLAYRSVLKESHATRKSVVDTQGLYKLGAKHGLYSLDGPSEPGMLAVEQMINAYLVEETKRHFDAAYLSKRWSALRHSVLSLKTQPCLAVSSMLSTDILSTHVDGPAYVALNVFPHDDHTVAVFSCLAQDSGLMAERFSALFAASGQYQLYELSKLILRRCENLVIAPRHYESFSSRQRQAIEEYFRKNTGGHEFKAENPEIFLFGAVRNDA
jgi:hypothetical protein